MTPNLIGKRCPCCDEVMLTSEDYREYCRVERRLVWAERIIRALGFLRLLPSGRIMRATVKDGDTVTKLREGGVL
ncbi:hypothetical protein B9J07_27990 [Sinorhizobium sp. LM21]|uniref:hypothetical protein n=1 Tax=Sinorhizobium sp. LM21 TaxID=1449788 RepID=UPI0005D8B044|nr:hypothetical protein [Sinorhizobium sp. LM21]AJW30166.1 hypothetical protein pLM21S1_p46 [Sinorhizobium sp. LM21]OWZ90431.1 hypothetical protein B9J07_27990 [Sinorhizobium sp. LM21]